MQIQQEVDELELVFHDRHNVLADAEELAAGLETAAQMHRLAGEGAEARAAELSAELQGWQERMKSAHESKVVHLFRFSRCCIGFRTHIKQSTPVCCVVVLVSFWKGSN